MRWLCERAKRVSLFEVVAYFVLWHAFRTIWYARQNIMRYACRFLLCGQLRSRLEVFVAVVCAWCIYRVYQMWIEPLTDADRAHYSSRYSVEQTPEDRPDMYLAPNCRWGGCVCGRCC